MIDFTMYNHFYGKKNPKTDGDIRKIQSDSIIEQTWFRDLQGCVGYLYDYEHDDEPLKNVNLNSRKSKTKIAIDIKFIINSYNSDNKTQVPYSIQFKPSQDCNVDYYDEKFAEVCNSEFPLGLYIDIPDNKGIYRRWLIYKGGNIYNRQFSTWAVLPCNYNFHWVKNGVKRKMWGVRRFREMDITTIQDGYYTSTINGDENIVLLPFNNISNELTYDDRLIVGASIDIPMVWKITSVNNADLPGVNRYVFKRDKFNLNADYVEKNSDGKIIDMWADYNVSSIKPIEPELPSVSSDYIKIHYKGLNSEIKIGGSYKTLYIQRYNEDNQVIDNIETVNWSFKIDGEDVDDLIDKIIVDDYTIKIKFLGGIDYLYKILTISADNNNINDNIDLEIAGL